MDDDDLDLDLDLAGELSDDDLLNIVKDTLGEGFDEEQEIEVNASDDISDDIFETIEKDINTLNDGITAGLDAGSKATEEVTTEEVTTEEDDSSVDEDNSLENETVSNEDEPTNKGEDSELENDEPLEEGTETKEKKGLKIPPVGIMFKAFKDKLKLKFKLSYTKTTVIMLVSLIVLVLIGGFFVVSFLRSSQELELEEFNLDSTIVIEHVTSGSNNSNHIYLYETRFIGNNSFTLSRMLIDQTATIFYFNGDINWENYSVSLMDDNERSYKVSNSFFVDNISNTISFEPLDISARGVILTIMDNQTGEETEFAIRFDARIQIMPTRFINDTINAVEEEYYNITLQGGTFSSAGSSIYYTMDTNPNGTIYFGGVSLMQGSQIIPNHTHLKYSIEGDNSHLGRIDFDPVMNISGNTSIRFEDVFTVHNLDMRIPIEDLFRNTVEDQIEIQIGPNTVVLERIGRIGNNYILVLHGMNEHGNRIETRLNANLKFQNQLGEEITLEGTTRSGANGTDMIFNINQLAGNSIEYSLSTFVLHIEEALFIHEDIIVPMPLDNLQSYINLTTQRVIDEGRDNLLSQGYDNVELITYMIDRDDFTAVYSARNGNIVSEYFVYATREVVDWNFTHTLIQ